MKCLFFWRTSWLRYKNKTAVVENKNGLKITCVPWFGNNCLHCLLWTFTWLPCLSLWGLLPMAEIVCFWFVGEEMTSQTCLDMHVMGGCFLIFVLRKCNYGQICPSLPWTYGCMLWCKHDSLLFMWLACICVRCVFTLESVCDWFC